MLKLKQVLNYLKTMAIYVNKDEAKKYLSNANENEKFYLESGKSLENIYDLRDFLDSGEEELYYTHSDREDFANWVQGVFNNNRLAESLRKARTPKEARLYTDRNIKMLERNANR